MYIRDKTVLRYVSLLLLIIVPFLASIFNAWSWVVEILLMLAVYIYERYSGLIQTAVCLGTGYLLSIFVSGLSGLSKIGYIPWAAVFLLYLLKKGWAKNKSIFVSMILVILLSVLPTVGIAAYFMQPEASQEIVDQTVQYYDENGMMDTLTQNGISKVQAEMYIGKIVPLFYQLIPAFSALLGMLNFGFVKQHHLMTLLLITC